MYNVSGFVVNEHRHGMPGVTMNFSDGTTFRTLSTGYWQKTNVEGPITITPTLTGFTFTPESIAVSKEQSGIIFAMKGE